MIKCPPEPQVLYSDPGLVVLIKPTGMCAQPDKSGALSVPEWVEQHLPGAPAFVVQRLDRPCAGIMAVARGADNAGKLSEAFKSRQVHKVYWALVENYEKLDPSGTLETYLVRNGRTNKSESCPEQPGAKLARLDYRILGTGKTRALVEIVLHTGRHHQIRAQFASIGCPLAGDIKYGASSALRQGGIALFACQLGLPFDGKMLSFRVHPQGRCWQPFLEQMGLE